MTRKKDRRRCSLLLLATGVLILLLVAIWYGSPAHCRWRLHSPSAVEQIPPDERTVPDLILLGAREEVRKRTRYDASYQAVCYPGGDVDPGRGACSDVIIRALRAAGYDLQLLIHEDMAENFNLYPQLWNLSSPDPNIDHRRTQNQMIFFGRFGEELTLGTAEEDLPQWKHGDFVYWRFAGGQQHTGVISDRTNSRGIPLVIHNGSVAREEDCLLRWEIIGHYRFPAQP
ncbi:MAG TPA: DUF1287 domain-containing protein [Firmicutes bacterium]|nr:DUF1287 domain-containing protein [Bacillota bacterium]